MRTRTVLCLAFAVSLGLGLAFIFVRAPHPWGWEGFDDYRRYALTLARGETFPTLEVPWGYPAFLAVFYRAFGDRQWIPLVVQVVLNAAIPLMIFAAVRSRVGERDARAAAIVVAVLSFNTVYASTQTSDSIATFLFVATVVLFLRGHDKRRASWFAAAGVAAGAAMQVRPNMLLVPIWFGALAWLFARPRPSAGHLAAFVLASAAVLMPWIVRNARLTGRFIPASAHGGIQLWYGSLQAPPYFPNWFDNPRQIFGERTFPASQPDGREHVVSIGQPSRECGATAPRSVTLIYWTDRQPAPVTLPAKAWQRAGATFTIPPQPADTVIYYYADAVWPSPRGEVTRHTPFAGALDPLVHFVAADDLRDVDRHDDFVDLFDVVRLVRHIAWREPLAGQALLDLDKDGGISLKDLDVAVGLLHSSKLTPVAVPERGLVREIVRTPDAAALIFADGSSLTVPRAFSGSVLDLEFHGALARGVINSRRSFRSYALTEAQLPALRGFAYDPCLVLDAGIDTVFYRAQPQAQDRYARLALDDIRRAPAAFALGSARRLAGMFVTLGSESPDAAHQFGFSRVLYAAAAVVSIAVFALFVSGAVVAWRRGADVLLLVAAVLYVPVTICPFLTNARYSVSGQPFVLAFAAVALVAARDRVMR